MPVAHASLVSRYGPVPRYTLEVPSARASLDLKEDLRELEVALRIVNVEQVGTLWGPRLELWSGPAW